MDKTELLCKYMEEHWTQARQAEDQRASFTNIILLIDGAIIGILSGKPLVRDLLPLTILLVVFGIFGAIASEKLYERFRYQSDKAKFYGDEIYKIIYQTNEFDELKNRKNDAEEYHYRNHPIFGKFHLHFIWLTLHLIVSIAGIVLTYIIIK